MEGKVKWLQGAGARRSSEYRTATATRLPEQQYVIEYDSPDGRYFYRGRRRPRPR